METLILLDVWREACRHIELAEAVALMAPILARELPLASVTVRRIDVGRGLLQTLAIGLVGGGVTPTWNAAPCSADELEELLVWCRRNSILHGSAARISGQVRSGVPSGLKGDVLLGPLSNADGAIGALVLSARPGEAFAAEHEPIMQALLEPFSVAVENDTRLREMATLREAAEADKRSLLTRLGRQDIGDTVVGAEQGLRHVMERVGLVAKSDAPVLLFGETGSGKEVIARAIHVRSPRAGAPFVRVNCGAIPPDLIDSELFGHEKGSFTGAAGLRKGWFERADGGTLFLDEIGELPPAAQVRLLRILQDGTFERVGGQRQLHVNVRIVAATHRNLQAMVAEGSFREDLWYRIAIFPIFLPALRDRPQDIPELAAHFATKAARRFGLAPLTPTPDDIHLLLNYAWPGNVRELGAVLDRAVILGDGKRLEVAKSLGAADRPDTARPVFVNEATAPQASTAGDFLTLDAAMKRHIELALARTRGRVEGKQGAAALLKINPHTLRARMRKLGINWETYRPREG